MKIEIELTEEGHAFLVEEARTTHSKLTVEEWARSVLAQHIYQAKLSGRNFTAARAAQDAIEKRPAVAAMSGAK